MDFYYFSIGLNRNIREENFPEYEADIFFEGDNRLFLWKHRKAAGKSYVLPGFYKMRIYPSPENPLEMDWTELISPPEWQQIYFQWQI